MKRARKLRLLVLLALANVALVCAWSPENAPSHPDLVTGAAAVRRQRAAAQAAARAAGRTDYSFETTWSPPLAANH